MPNTENTTRILRLNCLPENFEALAEDIAAQLIPLYGEAGACMYLEQAEHIFSSYITDPTLRFWAEMERDRCHAAVLSHLSPERGEITLTHRLGETQDPARDAALLHTAIADLKERGADCVLAEFLPTSPFASRPVFAATGFVRVTRDLLSLTLDSLPSKSLEDIRPLDLASADDASHCLAQSYADDPGRHLHAEVQGEEGARGLIERVLAGGFGVTMPGMNLGLWRDGECVALALGCLLAPRMGFTLQLAVHPDYRLEGLARRILDSQLCAFMESDCVLARLAVTRANIPACKLYRRMGYATERTFDAQVWYRDWPPQSMEDLRQLN
jgi:ribosomal protein S18 acetylase RimI-like enzyme